MSIQADVKRGIGPVVVFLAILIVAGMTAAASIESTLKTAVLSAASMVELYLFLYMVDRV